MSNIYYSSDDDDNSGGGCRLCGRTDYERNHNLSELHRFNFLLYEFNHYRKAVARDRNGIETSVSTNNVLATGPLRIEQATRKGEYVSLLTEQEISSQRSGITYIFKVTAKRAALLMHCHILRPDVNYFKYNDRDGHLSNDSIPRLEQGSTYTVELKLHSMNIGEYRMPIAFVFQTIDNTDTFSIVKEMVIRVIGNPDLRIPEDIREKSPFTNKKWQDVYTFVKSTQNTFYLNKYEIPGEYKNAFTTCLRHVQGLSIDDRQMIHKISNCLDTKIPARKTYKDFFHYLLWLDETGAELKIHRYNMEAVRVKLVQNNIVELAVPGLAEKRPSIIKGDFVNMRIHKAPIVYQGIVKDVQEKVILIRNFAEPLLNAIRNYPTLVVDVHFEISRLCYERMHNAVFLSDPYLDMLFPTLEANRNNKPLSFTLSSSAIRNPNIRNNAEQREAVANILNRTSGNAPYIVFGPPGTGKTVTIVEAIVHIVARMPSAKILVCAPANAACDMIVLKLSEYFTPDDLIRIHSESADWGTVPEKVKKYSNRTDTTYVKIKGNTLQQKYKIIVTTLISAGSYTGHFTASHVFLDEAAQAMEPEALVAVAGILLSSGQLVLAGDPKQLGPMCQSLGAEQRGLAKSLLSRLTELPVYQSTNRNHKHFITMLKLNYRNHSQILKLPNEFFYNSELQAISRIPLYDPINKIVLPVNSTKNLEGRAIEFCGVNGIESKEGRSPSYYNSLEVDMVMKYLKVLTDRTAQVPVEPEEIGVIVPYIRQSYRIRRCLQDELKRVEVGTTETFQGREKRVMIISTVRAQSSLLLYDKKYNIGFVNNPQRFNVAVTRAISKLIVIGNPQCLNTDVHWFRLMAYCKEINSYRGFHAAQRTADLRQNIMQNVNRVHIHSNRQQNNGSNVNDRRRPR